MLPVILHHGIFAFDELRLGPLRIHQFPGIPAALRSAGYTPLLTRVHPTASIPRRAEQLKSSILTQLASLPAPPSVASSLGRSEDRPRRPVASSPPRALLIAHSLGGLDARYMLSHLNMSPHIAALLTISTPHHGASLADFYHHLLSRKLPLYQTLSALGLDLGAATDLTRPAMKRFNRQTPDHPDVAYYSISCSVPRHHTHTKFRLSHRLIEHHEGPNDGVVSAASATYATHLAHWPLDHLAAINRPPRFPPRPTPLSPRPTPRPQMIPLLLSALQTISPPP